jgi:molybdopterin synthase sulfur carrier subunit
MTVKLLYFAWVREKAGRAEEDVELPGSAETVADVIAWLKTRGPDFAEAFARGDVIRAAINQTHVKHSAPVDGAREIAFFPPVTGG